MDFLTAPIDGSLALGAAQPPAVRASGDAAEVRKTAEDFEAFFLSQMFEHMFSGIEPDALFGGGQGEAVFRSMMFQEYGKSVARQGGIGLADMVQKEMLKLQEAQQP
jgi:Rod binding domain-containing protein